MMLVKWEQISNQLTSGLMVMLVVVFFLSKAKLFRGIMLKSGTSANEKIGISVFFGVVGILGSYIGLPVTDGFANIRAIGVVVAGLVGGRAVGLGAGLIAGFHRYYLGGFSALGSALATVLEGFAAGMFSKRVPAQEKWPYALVLGFFLEFCHMILLLLVDRPFEQAVRFVEEIAPPMLFMNTLGITALVIILENIFREQELVEGAAARLTLQIASTTVTYLRKGLNRQSAEKTAQIIYSTVKELAAVVVTNRTEVLSSVGAPVHGHIGTAFTRSTERAIATGEYTLAQTRAEIGCQHSDCLLGSKIVAPLKDHEEVIGALIIYKFGENSIRPFEIELIKGLALLISTQLEVSKGERQSVLLARAEIKALQAQVNPHFLFNALNTIVYYCRKQPETARKLLIHLGNYYRNNLTLSDTMISLEKEIQRVNDYVKIEAARFQGKLRVIYDIPEECKCYVPPLILQPIVENAIKHGLYPKREGGTVTISGRAEEDKVKLMVEDNGVGMAKAQIKEVFKPDPKGDHIGISNVNNRLKNFCGEQYGLFIESELGKGTKVTISLPAAKEDEDVKSDYCG
ncbi:signal transduction histidine kinase internal region [Lucifera butyrica]|uniref:histidine kinase n=1 Tax=Lucifera butyrica TaxID=1351585 RepID=A0A498RHS7_9FIRM|nr:LytS/YhcK type 5TM receptor domain-containing protein [Lucifera butyrica]VBB09642.1 signal transduction histidine kinase internal region [Lucifera butyrica]